MTLFALIVAVVIVVGVGALAYHCWTDPNERKALIEHPGRTLFVIVGALLFLMFLIGVILPPLGNIGISVGNYTFRVWAIGLMGIITWTIVGWPFLYK